MITRRSLLIGGGAGAGLLVAYALGLGVPFLLAAFYLPAAMARLRALGRLGRALQIGSGGLMVLFGLAIATGELGRQDRRALPCGLGAHVVGSADRDTAGGGADAALHDVGLGATRRDAQPEAADLGIPDQNLPRGINVDRGHAGLGQLHSVLGHLASRVSNM